MTQRGIRVVDAAAIDHFARAIDHRRFRRNGHAGGLHQFMPPIHDFGIVPMPVFLSVLARLAVAEGRVHINQGAGDALGFVIGTDMRNFRRERIRNRAIVRNEKKYVGFTLDA